MEPAPGNSPTTLIEQIKAILGGTWDLERLVRHHAEGDIILREGQQNKTLHVVLDGHIDLIKGSRGVIVEHLQPGALLGLLSYSNGRSVFTTAIARAPLRLLCLEQSDYERLAQQHPELKRLLDSLTISNLADRYRRSVLLNIERAHLTARLEEEGERLHGAINRLEQTRTALISHEKMATLGQLVAGVAHELNNPASALQHSVERLNAELPVFIAETGAEALSRQLLQAGLDTGSEPDRQRLRDLEQRHPQVGRPLLRRFCALPSPAQQQLEGLLSADPPPRLGHFLQAHQIGVWLRSVAVSSQRIVKLVQSLKNYSRQDGSTLEEVDPRQGILDTLLILQSRLRNHQVEVRLEETPPVRCHPGSINQVWTNLIVNAADAMTQPGILTIQSRYNPEAREVCVDVTDTGPGIPASDRARIFDMNFTTKANTSGFGLGLGLVISREIIQKYGGRIEVEDNAPRGARFRVILPAAGRG